MLKNYQATFSLFKYLYCYFLIQNKFRRIKKKSQNSYRIDEKYIENITISLKRPYNLSALEQCQWLTIVYLVIVLAAQFIVWYVCCNCRTLIYWSVNNLIFYGHANLIFPKN